MIYTFNDYMSVSLFSFRSVLFGALWPFLKPVSTPPCGTLYLLHLRCSHLSFGILSFTSIRRYMVEQGHLCRLAFLPMPCRCGHHTCHRSVLDHCRPPQDQLKASYLLKIKLFLTVFLVTSHLKNIFMGESCLW